MIRPRQGPSISSAISGLTCPVCGRSLVPIHGDSGFYFQCKGGDEFTVSGLAPLAPPKLRLALKDLVDALERDTKRMADAAAQASEAGYLQIAEVYYRQVPRLERRLGELRAGLSRVLGKDSDPAVE